MKRVQRSSAGTGLAGASLLVLAGLGGTLGPAAAEGLGPFPAEPIADARLRYETVEQDGFSKDAKALTARLRLGVETHALHGFSALVEVEGIVGLNEDYNSTTNGNTAYPVVPDPDNFELNRAQINYKSDPFDAAVGRQRIILDNARFVGNVGWRQNEQTYDAALVTLKAIPNVTLTYAFVDSVQRIFGNASPVGDFDSDSHLINVAVTGIPHLKLTGYGYLLDLENAPAASTETFGLRAALDFKPAESLALGFVGEYANQGDYGANPNSVDLDYLFFSAEAKMHGFDVSAAYEELQGNGTVGFSTPLATLHAFQGWADVFLTTPAAGITDMYGRIGYTSGKVGPFAKVIAAAIYHDFEAEKTGAPLGDEIDLLLKGVINKNLSVTAKYASYDGPTPGPASRDKVWVEVDWNL